MIEFYHIDEPELIYAWVVDGEGVVTIYWQESGVPHHLSGVYSKNHLQQTVDKGIWVLVE